MILVGSSAGLAATAGNEEPYGDVNKASGMTVHIPIPLPSLADFYGGIHQDVASARTDSREWVTLGGGSGFLKYRLWPGEQAATTSGDRLLSQATFPFGVEYAKRINGSLTKLAECGQRDPTTGTGRLSVNLATTFTQGRDYSLLPASTITSVEAKRSCLLSEQGVDTAPLVVQVYRSDLQEMLPAMDRKAAALVPLKPTVARVWKDLQDPLLLDEERALWLVVNPQAMGPAGIETLSGTPAAAFGLTARPSVVRGAKPTSRYLPLPASQDRVHDDGFHVSFAVQVPIEEADQRLREAVVGQEWSLGVGTIKIVGVTLYPLGSQVGVELTLRGLLPLTLRLKGTPVYDESKGQILFRNFDYTIKERTTATDLAEEWLHEPLREELAERLAIPIREELDLMRKTLEKGLNRDLTGGRLRGTVENLSLESLSVQADNLLAKFHTDGALRYDVRADAVAP
jgi:hypothetical protein